MDVCIERIIILSQDWKATREVKKLLERVKKTGERERVRDKDNGKEREWLEIKRMVKINKERTVKT